MLPMNIRLFSNNERICVCCTAGKITNIWNIDDNIFIYVVTDQPMISTFILSMTDDGIIAKNAFSFDNIKITGKMLHLSYSDMATYIPCN